MIKQLDVSQSTIYFKLHLFKILEKSPKQKKSLLLLNLLKNLLKTIKKLREIAANKFVKISRILRNFVTQLSNLLYLDIWLDTYI